MLDDTSRAPMDLAQAITAVKTAVKGKSTYWEINRVLDTVRKQHPQFSIWGPGALSTDVVICDKFQRELKYISHNAKAGS